MENNIPNLTLTPDENGEPKLPNLTLTPEEQEAAIGALDKQDLASVANAETPDASSLSEEERAAVSEFAKKIDLTNTSQVLQFGAAAQKNVSSFSETALKNVRTKDIDEVGGMITSLVVELKGFSTDDEKKGGFFGLFRKAKNQIAEMQIKYDTVEKNVDKICAVLEGHQMTLLKDVAMLDQMYDMNLAYFKELTMYILAGRERLKQAIEVELPALQEKARQSGKPEDAQAANTFADMCNRFDKKLHDLELTRAVCLQMGPQIRLVQSNDSIMIEKIQSSLVNTIPLWKNQMVLALGLAHSKSAIEAQREVTDVTNELLKKNADTLKMSTIEAAKESERSIIDIETLRHTNAQLISTLDEVMQIQQDGRAKRRAAEVELGRIEDELKNKLLELRDTPKIPTE